MKKLWYLVLALYLCINIIPKYVFAYQPTATTQAKQAVHVTAIQQEGTTEYFQYKLSIPQFSQLPHKGFEKKLNSYYKENILTFKKKLESAAKKYYDAAEQHVTDIHPYVADVEYEVTLNTPVLLSLYLNYYEYTGGAHGMYIWRANTFDVQKKKELQLADLFKKDSRFLETIKQEMQQQLEQDKEKFFPDAAALIEKASTFPFFLEREQLVIYYPLYEIAPYASGIPTFRIPYTLLENDLKASYQKILIDR